MSDETKEILTAILYKLETLDSKVDSLQEQQQGLKQEMNALTNKVDGLTDRVDDLTDKVDGLVDRVDGLQGEMNTRFNYVDRHLRLFDSDYELIIQKLATHEREINRLKPSS